MPQKMGLQQLGLHQINFTYLYHNCVTTEYVFAINPVWRKQYVTVYHSISRQTD